MHFLAMSPTVGSTSAGAGLCSVSGFTKTKTIYPDGQNTNDQLAPAGELWRNNLCFPA